MADREQSQTSKRGMDEKPQRDVAGKGHPTSGSKGEERQHGVRNMGSGRRRQLLRKDAAEAKEQQQKWGSHKVSIGTHSK